MLNLHVGLVRLVDHMLPLLVHHLRLTMLSVHHGHLAAVADLRSVALLGTNWVRAIRSRRVMLLVLRWTLALDRLVVHGNANVSLVVGSVGRRMRSGRTVSRHWHGLRGDHGSVLEGVRHGSRVALHDIWAGV
jgi:hypothetical protein